ncbi:MAG: radical SAM protein [Planctomycetes bacterium]|nr:radical SAM protein [Planctomycetota bacterium]MCB9888507.1 radical SAM protein [Planctomycetota bacterium]
MSELESSAISSSTEPGSSPKPSTASSAAGEGPRREESIHDFTRKLRQPGLLPGVVDYLKWRRALERSRAEGLPDPATPSLVPGSINLDLTTACNYRCDHCIDWDILNDRRKHDDAELRSAMQLMAKGGLRSVILIGGGEPTLYPGFVSFVEFLKSLDLMVAVVSNGSRGDRLLEIAPFLRRGDWVRLSLDSGSNATFTAMHKPARQSLTLDEICSWIPKIRAANPEIDLGYSFIITWKGGARQDTKVIENIHEIVSATQRARDAQFSYISFKPFLERTEDGAEVMDPSKTEEDLRKVRARIVAEVDRARKLERPGFRVMESTNLRMLEEDRWRNLTAQPRTCHMQALRQVVTPIGTFNCPAYRGVGYAQLGEKDAYKDPETARTTAERTKALLDGFDASHNCREVTCLYHATNWWMEGLIHSDADLDAIEAAEDRRDFFL